MGSNLATLTSDADYNAAKAICQAEDTGDSWGCATGLWRDDGGLPWKWRDGSNIDYLFNNNDPLSPTGQFPWNGAEPNDANGVEDCVQIREFNNFLLNDIPCEDSRYRPIPICNGIPEVICRGMYT